MKGLSRRIELIDALRGLSILLMIIYHGAYDLYLWCGLPSWLLFNPLINTLQVFFACVFIAVSGAATQFSKNNIKRAFIMLAAAAVVTAVTYVMDSTCFVVFGILHFLGVAALVYALLPKFKINPYFCVIAFGFWVIAV